MNISNQTGDDKHFGIIIGLIPLLIGGWLVRSQSVQNGATTPHVIKNLGLGYNLLTGNPEGGDTSHAGIDPGLLLTKQVLKLSPGDIPKEVVYGHHPTCSTGNSIAIFYGGKSYQDYLLQDVNTFGAADNYIKPYAFMMSKGYQDVDSSTRHRHFVYRDVIRSCSIGHARYPIPPLSGTVTLEFASNVCGLPVTYNETAYISFLDKWGTHIVTEEEIGQRTVNRYIEPIKEIAELMYKHNESIGSMKVMPYLGYGTMIEFNVTKFRHDEFQNAHDGTLNKVFSYGNSNNPEVIAYQLTTIAEVFGGQYWSNISMAQVSGCTQENTLPLGDLKNNIIHALQRYATVKGISGPPNDPKIIIPVTWPRGTYGLMNPITGCPTSPFGWQQGWTYQDNDYHYNYENFVTTGNHLAGSITRGTAKLEYCLKTDRNSSDYERDWQPGNYCLLKKGPCPTGFSTGEIFWDDNDVNNANSHGGDLPDGTFDADTNIGYCCRSDGNTQTSIMLPIDKPFYLIRYTASDCQQVKNMEVKMETVLLRTNRIGNGDRCIGSHPYSKDCSGGYQELYYCYYKKYGTSVFDPIFG